MGFGRKKMMESSHPPTSRTVKRPWLRDYYGILPHANSSVDYRAIADTVEAHPVLNVKGLEVRTISRHQGVVP
jgi:hypothetical protein